MHQIRRHCHLHWRSLSATPLSAIGSITPFPGEAAETAVTAINVATMMAGDEARKSGKTYLVATTPDPSPDCLCVRL
jgi:hypothetical protein